jgi:endonuclease-3
LSIPPRDNETKRQLLREVAEALRQPYGVPYAGPLDDPLEVLIRTVLSQNTTDTNRDRAYEALRRRFPRWEDLLEADPDEIAEAITVGGLARQKSVRIKEILRWVHGQWGEMTLAPLCAMGTAEAREVLLGLKGVGLKTANCVLAFGCGRAAFPVDTHILRIAKRLGLIPARATAEQAHLLLAALVPDALAIPFHLNLIRYGREICKARHPHCSHCLFPELCTLPLDQREGYCKRQRHA